MEDVKYSWKAFRTTIFEVAKFYFLLDTLRSHNSKYLQPLAIERLKKNPAR